MTVFFKVGLVAGVMYLSTIFFLGQIILSKTEFYFSSHKTKGCTIKLMVQIKEEIFATIKILIKNP